MHLTKSKIFLFSCVAFVTGIGVASFWPVVFYFGDISLFVMAIFSLAAAVMFWKKARTRLGFLLLALFLLGIWRVDISRITDDPEKIWHYNGETAVVSGLVVNEPDIRVNNQKLEIAVSSLKRKDDKEELAVSGRLLVTTHLYPISHYGDELRLDCRLEAPEAFEGFAYDRYLARYDIYSVCFYPKADLIVDNQGYKFYSLIFHLKDRLRTVINRGLPEPQSSLAKAILLGDKKGINQDLRTIFSQAGVSHIFAISGLHISIIAAMAMSALLVLGLPRRKAFYAATSLLALYIILIGLPASAMRAGLMGFLVLYAMRIGRLANLTNSLIFAAALLLLFNPKLLRDDIGFQLSFLAVAGIAYVKPLLSRLYEERETRLKGVYDLLAVTLSAQAFTLPLIAVNFSTISLIAPFSNLMILFLIPLLFGLLVFGITTSLIMPMISPWLFLPAGMILGYMSGVSKIAVNLPYSYVLVENIPSSWLMIWYAAVIGIILLISRNSPFKIKANDHEKL